MRNTAPAAKLAGAVAATCMSRFTNAAARRLLTSARTACENGRTHDTNLSTKLQLSKDYNILRACKPVLTEVACRP